MNEKQEFLRKCDNCISQYKDCKGTKFCSTFEMICPVFNEQGCATGYRITCEDVETQEYTCTEFEIAGGR